MAGCSAFEDYFVGQSLALTSIPRPRENSSTAIHVRIRKLHTRTLSCTMAVDIEDGGQLLPSHAFLKLYDRRFADQLRRDFKAKEWTREVEEAYIQSVGNGSWEEFLYNLHKVPYFQDDTEDDWADWQNEAHFANELLKFFKAEVAAYNALYEQQGKTVPKLLTVVQLDLAIGANTTPTNLAIAPKVNNSLGIQPFQVKGILLQYIEGFSLRQVPERCPRSTWQGIIDQAVSIVRLFGDYNILNEDVRTENCIISPTTNDEGEQRYHVFMIDFGHCLIRREDETDLEWGRAKCTLDEEGAIGLMMQMILKRDYGFELRYESSGRYDEWADTDESLT